MVALSLIAGDRRRLIRPMVCGTIGQAVLRARAMGFEVGAPVLIGAVEGEIVGYNIASHGLFYGGRYPLLVSTRLGTVKCGTDEVALAVLPVPEEPATPV